ncbi:hypothetical protein R83H12_01432 [Fibrobacteria bacterium R8-3-H12]
MFAKNLKIWLFLLLVAAYAHASVNGIVAVLEVVISEDTDDESKALELTIQQTRFLTDELRKQAALTLAKNYAVLTREKIIELSANVPSNATTVVDIGRAIKSDYVTNSSLSYLGGLLVFTVEIYNCESGLLVGDFVKMAPDLKGLLDIIHENAPALFKKINPPEPEAPVAAPVAAPENTPVSISANIPAPEAKAKGTNWLAIGLEAAGVAAIGFGLYQFTVGNDYYDKYKDRNYFKSEREAAYKDAKSAKTLSTISYIAGGVLLASGITIHILF